MRNPYDDGRSRAIDVSFWGDGQFRPCGRIRFNSQKERGSFEYDETWDGPPIDPIHLNYAREGRKMFEVDPAHGNDLLHRVFIDYLPGLWGLQVLRSEHPELGEMRAAEKLHWFGSRTVGSLAFHVERSHDEQPVNGIDRLEEIRRRSVDLYLSKIERIGDLNLAPGAGATHKLVLEGLSGFGGARPKCLFEDQKAGQWLAKFNIDSDPYNFARVEHAIAKLSKRCGIDTVETQAHPISDDNDILFVKRFDRETAGRKHKVSAFSLMRADIVKHHSMA